MTHFRYQLIRVTIFVCDALMMRQFRLSAVFLEFPVSVVQGTYRSGLEPSGNAVEMESVLDSSAVSDSFMHQYSSS